MQCRKIIFLFFIWTHSSYTTSLYIDLMKRILINHIYQDKGKMYGQDYQNYSFDIRTQGLDWPLDAHTMIGLEGLNNLEICIEDILANNIPGDFIETGVWRGGASIFMRALLKDHEITNRKVWVADSFKGLPKPNKEKYPFDESLTLYTEAELAVSLSTVKDHFKRYNLLDGQVVFLEGWFSQTLPTAPIKQLALIRLDGDMYESTMDALINLYPKLSVGGYVIIDDYSIPQCKQAIHNFRTQYNIRDPLCLIGLGNRAFWQRTSLP